MPGPPPAVAIAAPIPTEYFAPTSSPLAQFPSQFQHAFSHLSSPIPTQHSPGVPLITATTTPILGWIPNPIAWWEAHVRTGFQHYLNPWPVVFPNLVFPTLHWPSLSNVPPGPSGLPQIGG
jgi:hypothetical protein